MKWRVMYYACARSGNSAHTVLVQDIAGTAHGTVIGRIFEVWASVSHVRGEMLVSQHHSHFCDLHAAEKKVKQDAVRTCAF